MRHTNPYRDEADMLLAHPLGRTQTFRPVVEAHEPTPAEDVGAPARGGEGHRT